MGLFSKIVKGVVNAAVEGAKVEQEMSSEEKRARAQEAYLNSYEDTPDFGSVPDCPECGGEMGYNYVKNECKCKDCGAVFDSDELDWDDENEDGIPYGCRACGGPYPDCMTSCKIFDD